MKESFKEENRLLEELALESPDKLIFTEAGTILQDYISAYRAQFNALEYKSAGSNTYLGNLVFAVVERINKNTQTIN